MSFPQVFLISLLLRLVLALILPLALDEYYYFLWGGHLSLSYFDHPPMVGWLMGFAQPLSRLSEGWIRLPFIFVSQATLGLWWLILKNEKSELPDYWFLWLAVLNPLWGLGAVIATPDIPLLFFWSLSLFFCQKILQSPNWFSYVGLGASLGLGFCSKYHIVLFVPSLLWMVHQTNNWRLLFNSKTLLTVLSGLVCSSPVLVWNWQQDWVSFRFQWQHGMGGHSWTVKQTLEYLTSQAFLLFPPLLYIFGRSISLISRHWLFPFVAFPFGFFLYSSFQARVEANWVIMAFPSFYFLVFIYSQSKDRWLIRSSFATWGLALALVTGLLLFESPWLSKTRLYESKKFESIRESLRTEEPVYAYNYQLAAYLSFYRKELVCKLPGFGRPDHFDTMASCGQFPATFVMVQEQDYRLELPAIYESYQIESRQLLTPGFDLYRVVEL